MHKMEEGPRNVQGEVGMPKSSFPSKRLTYLLEVIADEAIAGNDAIFQRDLGCSIREIRVLRIVDDNPGITFVEICEKSGLERSLTSRILQKLIGDGLLLRSSSGTDARKYQAQMLAYVAGFERTVQKDVRRLMKQATRLRARYLRRRGLA